MADQEKALATQLANIEKRTGKTLDELAKIIAESGLSKHGELVAMLKSDLGMGHGDANTSVHTVRRREEKGTTPRGLEGLYVGPKAALRPIHDKLLDEIKKLGNMDEARKKTYVSYRRKKQFATVGPATKTSVEVGLNMKGVDATERLEALPAGRMCNYRVRLSEPGEVDAELLAWIKTAYDSAG
jgi:hypothetical protein